MAYLDRHHIVFGDCDYVSRLNGRRYGPDSFPTTLYRLAVSGLRT